MLLDLPAECTLAVLKRVGVADVLATGCCCKTLRALVCEETFWADLAEAKWGERVKELKPQADADTKQRAGSDATAAEPVGHAVHGGKASPATVVVAAAGEHASPWMMYCCKRMSLKSIRPSPLCLLQESYPDPWQHIICCVLCSRTSGSSSIRDCIAKFFAVLPTPTAVLAAPDAFTTALVHPLGLQASRLAAVKAVSRDFLGSDWQEPAEFKGCGKFVSDSWRIFCKGCRDAKGVDDAKLKQYLAWANKQQQEGKGVAQSEGLCDTTAAGIKRRQQHASSSQGGSTKQRGGTTEAEAAAAASKHVYVRARAAAAAGAAHYSKAAPAGGAGRAARCRATRSKPAEAVGQQRSSRGHVPAR